MGETGTIDTRLIEPDRIDDAVAALRAGKLVAFPTETVYGLGADATNDDAVAAVFEAKGRPLGHPLIVHIADPAQLSLWSTTTDPRAALLADACWPGPLTLILPSTGLASSLVTGARTTVGLRVPDHPVTLELLARFAGGVAGPSANRFGRLSPTTAGHVGMDLAGRVDLIIDGGPANVGVESTIVELVDDHVRILRPGGITAAQVTEIVGEAVVDGASGESRAAGMLASHYAPRAQVRVVEDDEIVAAVSSGKHPVAVLSAEQFDWSSDDGVRHHPMPADTRGFAAALYATLRTADVPDVALIIVVPPQPDGGPLPAILDRLAKASAPR